MFIALKTVGDIRHRARTLAIKLGLVAAVLSVVFMLWTQADTGNTRSAIAFVLAAVVLLAGLFAAAKGREGWAFTGTFLTIALAVSGLFLALFPDVMPSSTDVANRSEEHTSELQSLMRISYAVFCLKKKKNTN